MNLEAVRVKAGSSSDTRYKDYSQMAKRLILSHRKGYRKPAAAVVVSRPTKWGNPFDWRKMGKQQAARKYEDWLTNQIARKYHQKQNQWILKHLRELRGKDLACWCKLDEPCHADVLLRLANLPF